MFYFVIGFGSFMWITFFFVCKQHSLAKDVSDYQGDMKNMGQRQIGISLIVGKMEGDFFTVI